MGSTSWLAFFIFWYISFVYYKNGTFKREHTLPLIRA